ncbi:MAG: adenine phosphoribosyltransferase [Bacteroidota bacterium]
MDLKKSIRTVPNFPVAPVMFRDITTLMQDPEAFRESNDRFYERYKDQKIDKIVGIDARGFVFGAVLAYRLGVGFIPVRKKGKLPYKTISVEYNLEYGSAELQIHEDAISKGERIVIVDDLIATGGTVEAAIKLVETLGGEVVECAFIVELPDLKGRDKIKHRKIYTMIEFEGD